MFTKIVLEYDPFATADDDDLGISSVQCGFSHGI
jgi:hypothetical protein